MHADWKWECEGTEGACLLNDGRVLRARAVGDGRGTREFYSWIDITGRRLATEECILSPQPSRESAVDAVEKAAGVTSPMPGTESREVQALRNCRAMAAREVRKCPPGKERDAWEHVLRFCREGGVEASVMRSEPCPHAAASAVTGETFAFDDGMDIDQLRRDPVELAQDEAEPPQLSASAIARGNAIMAITQPCAPEADGFVDPDPFDPPQTARAAVEREAKDAGAFTSLREANAVRQREWDKDDRISLSYRGNELAGEVGEACNIIKKLDRERLGIRGSRASVEQLADELADVIICADLVAMMAGVDLDAAVVRKFNATSEKVGLKTRMAMRDRDALRKQMQKDAERDALPRPPAEQDAVLEALARAVIARGPDTRTEEQQIEDGVAFLMGDTAPDAMLDHGELRRRCDALRAQLASVTAERDALGVRCGQIGGLKAREEGATPVRSLVAAYFRLRESMSTTDVMPLAPSVDATLKMRLNARALYDADEIFEDVRGAVPTGGAK